MDNTPTQPVCGRVEAVAVSDRHGFSKQAVSAIEIAAGFGVLGDAHSGACVKHRSRAAKDPAQPNLRQLHLIHNELLSELAEAGFAVEPAQLGENITTAGLDLLALPRGTILRIGDAAVLAVTGLRNPCGQIEAFCPGLLKRLAKRRADDSIERLAPMKTGRNHVHRTGKRHGAARRYHHRRAATATTSPIIAGLNRRMIKAS